MLGRLLLSVRSCAHAFSGKFGSSFFSLSLGLLLLPLRIMLRYHQRPKTPAQTLRHRRSDASFHRFAVAFASRPRIVSRVSCTSGTYARHTAYRKIISFICSYSVVVANCFPIASRTRIHVQVHTSSTCTNRSSREHFVSTQRLYVDSRHTRKHEK